MKKLGLCASSSSGSAGNAESVGLMCAEGRLSRSCRVALQGIAVTLVWSWICCFGALGVSWAAANEPPELEIAIDHHHRGKLEDAIAAYTEAIKKDDKVAQAFNWRGMAYDDLGQLDKATADFQQALRLNPNYPDAHNNLGEAFRKQKKFNEAIQNYKKALELDPKFIEAIYNLGLVYQEQKNYTEALQSFQSYQRAAKSPKDREDVLQKVEETQRLMNQPAPPPSQPTGRTAPPPAGPAAAQDGRPAQPQARQEPAQPPAGPEQAGKPAGVRAGADSKPGPSAAAAAAPRAGAQKAGASAKPAPPPAKKGFMTGIPAMPEIPRDIAKGLSEDLGLIPSVAVIAVLFLIIAALLFLIAKATNFPLWFLAPVPVANLHVASAVARRPVWWTALYFLPLLAIPLSFLGDLDPTGGFIIFGLIGVFVLAAMAAWLITSFGLATAWGKPAALGLAVFLPGVILAVLLFLAVIDFVLLD